MTRCFFASDLHGRPERYERLFAAIREELPHAVFLGGDLLPPGLLPMAALDLAHQDFVNDFLAEALIDLKRSLGDDYSRIFVILGNDDPRFEEAAILELAARDLWTYLHDRRVILRSHPLYGYAYVPPTPFLLKDWERYDVSRYVDPGCVSPEEGRLSVPRHANESRYRTIESDLAELVAEDDLSRAVILFHTPPYRTNLDRADLDGQAVDHVPLDVNIGSIAVRRFIEERQPLVTLHGHVHESARLTGSWRDQIGNTHLFGAAHDGPELSLIRFDLESPEQATRTLL